jgi:hypothetical protein
MNLLVYFLIINNIIIGIKIFIVVIVEVCMRLNNNKHAGNKKNKNNQYVIERDCLLELKTKKKTPTLIPNLLKNMQF